MARTALSTKPKAVESVLPEGGLPEDLLQLREEVLEGLEFEDETDEDAQPAASGGKEEAELTEAAALLASGEDSLEDVTHLVFRDRGLTSLSTPRAVELPMLTALEVLSLSHNCLVDIGPLSVLASLQEVNLNFNEIEDISPIFECELLVKIFVAHNRVSSIDGIQAGCPGLKELSLFANRLGKTYRLVETLDSLPELRSLDIGENDCAAAPSQRYGVIRALPHLEFLDGQRLTRLDRRRAAEYQDAGLAGAAASGQDALATSVASSLAARPGTAPAVCASGGGFEGFAPAARPRPPPMPPSSSAGGGAGGASPTTRGCSGTISLAALPGQRLKSSRANRMDEVLSREPSPEETGGTPVLDTLKIDFSDPKRALHLLSTHSEALRRRLETVQLDKENLRFQIRMLDKEKKESEPKRLQEQVARLEAENRNARAVDNEYAQLKARLAEVEKLSAEADAAIASAPHVAVASVRAAVGGDTNGAAVEDGVDEDDAPAASNGDADDVLEELRWENQLLEKRLKRLTGYQEQLNEGIIRAGLQSSQRRRGDAAAAFGSFAAPEAPIVSGAGSSKSDAILAGGKSSGGSGVEAKDLERIISANEEMLRQLRCDVRLTATAIARNAEAGRLAQRPLDADGRPLGSDAKGSVDVLTIGEGVPDHEWHKTVDS